MGNWKSWDAECSSCGEIHNYLFPLEEGEGCRGCGDTEHLEIIYSGGFSTFTYMQQLIDKTVDRINHRKGPYTEETARQELGNATYDKIFNDDPGSYSTRKKLGDT